MALAGAAFFRNDLGRFAQGKELTGIQLYSVRDDMTERPSWYT